MDIKDSGNFKFVITLLPVYLNGGFEHVHLPSAEQLAEFAKAGPDVQYNLMQAIAFPSM